MTPEELEEQSFRNHVRWFAYKLRQIKNGEYASKLFTAHQLIHMRKFGILKRSRLKRRSVLTPRAEQVLNNL